MYEELTNQSFDVSEGNLPDGKELSETIEKLNTAREETKEKLGDNKKYYRDQREHSIQKAAKAFLREKSFVEIKDPLLKLAVGEFLNEYPSGPHHHCGCGTRADWFLERTEKGGIRDLVEYDPAPGSCASYDIPQETRNEARDKLISEHLDDYNKEQLAKYKDKVAELRETLERLENTVQEAVEANSLISKVSKHGLSVAASQALDKLSSVSHVKGIDENTFICVTERSEWGSSGGIGYFHELRVYHHGRSDLASFQWRDRFSADRDRHDLYINDLGEVTVGEDGEGNVTIAVELVNKQYGNRNHTFTLPPLEKVTKPSQPILGKEEQQQFVESVQRAINLVMKEKLEVWERQPKMVIPALGDYGPYRRPSLKDNSTIKEHGIAVFIIESQIDHRVDDPQMRYDVYVVRHAERDGDELKINRIFEDHSYDNREGNASVGLVDLSPELLQLSTRKGIQKISLEDSK